MVLLFMGMVIYAAEAESLLRYEGRDYVVEVTPSGAWRSFKVHGFECLDGTGASDYLTSPVLNRVTPDRWRGEVGGRFMEWRFTPDAFEIEVREEGQLAFLPMQWRLHESIQWMVMPHENGTTYRIPHDRHLNHNQGARFLSKHGVAFETYHRTTLSERDGGRTFGTFVPPDGHTMRFVPLTRFPSRDVLSVRLDEWPAHHFFPPGPLSMPITLENESSEAITVELTLHLSTYYPDRTAEPLRKVRERVVVPAHAAVKVELVADALTPGPYDFVLELAEEDAPFRTMGGVLMYDLEAWTLPDLEPSEFDAFWAETLAELRRRPLEAELTELTDTRGVPAGFQAVSFNGLGDRRVRGLIAFPTNLAPGERVPAKLSLPGAGYQTSPPDYHAAEQGMVSMTISVHDLPFGGESGRHHPRELWSETPYQEIGLAHRSTFFYRYAYAAAVRAVDYLRSLPMVDPDRIFVAGGSQGGSMALAVGALVPDVALISSAVPGRSRWDLLTFEYRANATHNPPPGLTREEIFAETLAYFDVSYMARRIQAPIHMGISLDDYINPGPLQVWAFREIPDSVDKRFELSVTGGHAAPPDTRVIGEMIRTYLRVKQDN